MTLTNHSRSLKVAFVFTMVFIIVHMLPFKEKSWPLITSMVLLVPSENPGHLFRRAGERIVGTCIGACFGIAALQLELHMGFDAMLPVCFVGAAIGGWFSRSRFPYASLIICVTMAVVVNAAPGDFHTALHRTMGIIIGAILSAILGTIIRI
jgi:uncharacterized membrane protein YccC